MNRQGSDTDAVKSNSHVAIVTGRPTHSVGLGGLYYFAFWRLSSSVYPLLNASSN